MSNFVVRAGKDSDADEILAVHRRSILGIGTNAYTQKECISWATGLTCEGYVRAMTTGGEDYLVALENNALLGFCSFRDNEIMGLYVSPEASRRGVGRQLLKNAEASITNNGKKSIKLTAALSALDFYKANDYQILNRKLWKTRGGREIQVCNMFKETL